MVQLHLGGLTILWKDLELSNQVLANFSGFFDDMEEHVDRFRIHLNLIDCLQAALKIYKAILVIGLHFWPRDILQARYKRLNSKSLVDLIYVTLSSADHKYKLFRVLAGGSLNFL